MITVRLTTEELDRFLSIAAFVDRKLPSPKKPICTTNFQLLDVSPLPPILKLPSIVLSPDVKDPALPVVF